MCTIGLNPWSRCKCSRPLPGLLRATLSSALLKGQLVQPWHWINNQINPPPPEASDGGAVQGTNPKEQEEQE